MAFARFVLVFAVALLPSSTLTAIADGSGVSLSQTLTIFSVGDSITVGYNGGLAPDVIPTDVEKSALDTMVAPYFQQTKIINYGIVGYSTVDWASPECFYTQLLLKDIAAAPAGPIVVQIQLGTNDAQNKLLTSAADYYANLQYVSDTLLATGRVNAIILNDLPYIAANDGTWTAQTADTQITNAYVPALKGLAASDPSLIYYGSPDVYDFFSKNTDLLRDGVHPTEDGYAWLGKEWASTVDTVLQHIAVVPGGADDAPEPSCLVLLLVAGGGVATAVQTSGWRASRDPRAAKCYSGSAAGAGRRR